MQTKKVIIIGAGPAGLSAAAEFSGNNNFEVTVLEKNPEPSYKICGGGIHPDFIKETVSPDIMDREFDKMKIITPKSTFIMEYNGAKFTGTLNRKKLNEELDKKARNAGANIIYGKTIKKIDDNKVITTDGEEFVFDYLVGADGVNSIVRKSLGITTKKFLIAYQYIIPGDYEDIEIHIDFQKFGITYSWIFPQKGVISVGTGYTVMEKKTAKDTKKLRSNFETWCKKRFSLEGAHFEGFSINYDYQGFEFGNTYLVGDAAGMASGLTGEGIKPAILSGQEVARKIQNPDYKYVNIPAYLKAKRKEDGILQLLISRPWGKIIAPIALNIFSIHWFKKILFKALNYKIR
ncbi:MAG: NAD(P)/FAD-dependent oxidoreductase [Candidatus Pacebacteria bacterium]|nr:NAD(P)/FAD-dependent oxidoreductase [Candidatus Paceibacterota bacterium]